MNWFSENKFLAGFFGFVVVALGVLGFLLWSAMGGYEAVHEEYTREVGKLTNLQAGSPTSHLYPSEDNLKKYTTQTGELNVVINKLENDLAKVQFPLNPEVTPQAFQDKLREAVNKTVQNARSKNVKIPDKFALGFDSYLAGLPKPDAAPLLARELSAMEYLINELISQNVTSIAVTAPIVRTPLVEESGAKAPKDNVRKSFVDISFACENGTGTLRKIMDELSQSTKQFYIIRDIKVHNPLDKGLTKAQASANKTTKEGGTAIMLGSERIEVSMKIEIVNFNPPAQK